MSAQQNNAERLWTPANVVTLLRICGVPLFVVAFISPWPEWFPQWQDADIWKPWIAAGVFTVLAATDGLDGYLARSRGEVTNFGKFIDPLADKILVCAALLALTELNILPSWIALVILCREFIVSGIRMVAASQGVVIAASWYGKAKTVTQIFAIILFIIKDSLLVASAGQDVSDVLYIVAWVVMIVAVILTIVSMLDYFVKAREILGFTSGKKSKPETASAGPEIASPAAFASPSQEIHSRIEFLSGAVIEAADRASRTIGTAESCTGGLISGYLTSIPGSSSVIEGGIVSYSNDVKMHRLGVSKHTLDTFGAVSDSCAMEMASGARSALSVDLAVSVTGVAGPGGGSDDKPVGTVWFGFSDGNLTSAHCMHFKGDREQVRLQTVEFALHILLNRLTGAELFDH